MKIAFAILCLALAMIAVILYVDLWRFYKLHAEEEFEVHKRYIVSRIIIIFALLITSTFIPPAYLLFQWMVNQ